MRTDTDQKESTVKYALHREAALDALDALDRAAIAGRKADWLQLKYDRDPSRANQLRALAAAMEAEDAEEERAEEERAEEERAEEERAEAERAEAERAEAEHASPAAMISAA